MSRAAALLLCASSAIADPEFNQVWHDGKAELDGYQYGVSRYGSPRTGRAVLIYVTEPFSLSHHVKVEDPSQNPGDAFDVFKLNLVRKFQTGIYDYNTMLSLFTRSDDLTPVKSAFSANEWCGQVYEELDFRGGNIAQRFASYFENESSAGNLTPPKGALLEDQLFITLRGLRGEWLRPGEKRTVPFLAGAFFRRLAHQKTGFAPATIERLAKTERLRVPAGDFTASVYVVEPADGRVGRFWVEDAYPHRIVRWAWTSAPNAPPFLGGVDHGELAGTARLEYWKLHNVGDEKYLKQLGLGLP
jgi:hypothetical protein